MSAPVTAPQIRIDYFALEKVAQQFDAERVRAEHVLEVVQLHINRLRAGGWEGDAADAFFHDAENDVLPALIRLKSALATASETTRTIIRLMKAAEDEAASALKGAVDEYLTLGAAPKLLKAEGTDKPKDTLPPLPGELPSAGKVELRGGLPTIVHEPEAEPRTPRHPPK